MMDHSFQPRLATPLDAAALARLPRLGEAYALAESLGRSDRLWAVSQRAGELEAAVCLALEPQNRLGKLVRMVCRGEGARRALSGALRFLMDQALAAAPLDLIYSTTRHCSLQEQEVT